MLSHQSTPTMKTANEQFYAKAVLARAVALTEVASDLRTTANALGDAYATCKGDVFEVRLAWAKYQNALTVAGEAEGKAYDAVVRASLYR